jgi:phage tail sheath protein FI
MPTDYHHGVRVVELSDGTRPIRTIETSVIGMVCTAPDADVDTFPLNTPVLAFGTREILTKAGVQGTLRRSLDAIKDQCEPLLIIVRIAEGADDEETISHVVGGTFNGRKTGLQALLTAKQRLGVKPRIIGVPDLDVNPAVKDELIVIAEKLRAFAYARIGGTDAAQAVTYRNLYDSKRLMLLWPNFRVWDNVAQDYIDASATARALGLRAKIDNETGWHKTLSNVPVNGVMGMTDDVYFDLQNTDTEADYLNENEITTMIRQDGFRFWGSRTCTADPLFAFENYTRTGDILADTIAEAHLWAVDKPMSKALILDIIDGINNKFRTLVQQGYLLGGSCWFDELYNPVDNIKNGKLAIDYDYTPVPPLEDLSFQQRITDRYVFDFTASLTANN